MQTNKRTMQALIKASALFALMTLMFLGNAAAQTAKTTTASEQSTQPGKLTIASVKNNDGTWGYEISSGTVMFFKIASAPNSGKGFATSEDAVTGAKKLMSNAGIADNAAMSVDDMKLRLAKEFVKTSPNNRQ